MGEPIGKGKYGTVYEVKNNLSYVVKKVHVRHEEFRHYPAAW